MAEHLSQHEQFHSHDHRHHHYHGGHDHEKLNTEKNLGYWDSIASSYNSTTRSKDFGDLLNKATAFVIENISNFGVDFLDPSSEFETVSNNDSPRAVRVLDYACGPGTITNALLGRANEFIGLDLSPNMVEEYNKRFNDPDSTQKVKATAFHGNLLGENIPELLQEPRFFNFDLAAVGLGFHHFNDVLGATKRLSERLKPGGVFMILDFFSHDHDDLSGDAAHGTITHHGFSEIAVKKLFADAGLQNTQLVAYPEEIFMKGKAKRRMFLAWGAKPA